MIVFDRVSRGFGAIRAVDDVSLTIPRGEFCVIVGPSGSGKTTLLRMVNRLVEHDAGRILIDGAEIRSFRPEDLRRRMGYAIQSVGLFPHWSVEDNIAAVPRLLGWDEARIAARVTELLALLSMEDERFRKARPAKLSGGQQQRVGVARALAADPEVLLMDEPFGALDPITREGLQGELARIHRATGKTILFVTHDIDEALALASRVVVLDRGRIVQAASPRQLVEAPGSDFVRDFIGRADLGLRRLAVLRVDERMRPPEGIESTPAIGAGESLRTALSRLAETHRERIAVVDEAGTVVGALHLADLVR